MWHGIPLSCSLSLGKVAARSHASGWWLELRRKYLGRDNRADVEDVKHMLVVRPVRVAVDKCMLL